MKYEQQKHLDQLAGIKLPMDEFKAEEFNSDADMAALGRKFADKIIADYEEHTGEEWDDVHTYRNDFGKALNPAA